MNGWSNDGPRGREEFLRRAALASIALLATVGCISGVSTICELVDPQASGQDPLVSTTLTVDENVQFVGVEMTNVSGRMLQLVLQEWSLSTSAETSNIVTAGTPNGQVQTVVLAPVTLSPGGKWTESVTMRSHHKLASGRHGGSYFTSMIPGVKQDALKQARHCEGSETITLLYVIQDGQEKKLGSLAVSPHYERLRSPQYEKNPFTQHKP